MGHEGNMELFAAVRNQQVCASPGTKGPAESREAADAHLRNRAGRKELCA